MEAFLQMTAFLALLALAMAVMTGAIPHKSSHETKGVLLVDAITMPKLIPSSNCDTLLLIAQKSQIGDYGTDSIRADYFAFADFIQLKAEGEGVKPVLFTQLIVNGAENLGYSKSLGMKDGFKHPKLFLIPKGSDQPIPYPSTEPYQKNNLVRFLNQHTDFYYKVPGTSKSFDQQAAAFVKASAEQRPALVAAAKEVARTLTNPVDMEEADYYIKTMEKVLDKGDAFINSEFARLNHILDTSKLSKASRVNIKNHVNVLKSFGAVAIVPVGGRGQPAKAEDDVDEL